MPTTIQQQLTFNLIFSHLLAHNFYYNVSGQHESVEDLMRRATYDGTKNLCLIRGPPSSGKFRCAEMMKTQLERLGNTSAIIVDNSYVDIKTSEDLFNAVQDQYMNQYNFVIVILPNGLFEEYMQFYTLGVSRSFNCYAIELYPRGNRAPWIFDSVPEHHILLDITYFNAPPPPNIASDSLYKRLVRQ